MAIQRLANGRWLARVFLDYHGPGGRRRDTSKVFDSEVDAKEWAVAQERAKQRGEAQPRTRMTVRSYLERWLDEGLSDRDIRERTKAGYRADLKRYILPNVPSVRLDQFGRQHVRRIVATLLRQKVKRGKERELSVRKIRHALTALRVAMADAIDDGLLRGENPVHEIRLPSGERRQGQWLDRAKAQALLAANGDDPLLVLWALLLYCGCRPSEALALRWENVDLERGLLRVEESLTPRKGDPAWVLTEPKTQRSRRSLPIPAEVVRLMESHRSRQQVERIVAGSAYQDHGAGGFCFAQGNGAPLREDGLARRLAAACTRAKIETVTPYQLRHTAASLMLAAGVPLIVVSRHLGHSTVTLTADVYGHLTSELQEQAMEQLSAYMASKPVES